VMLAFHSITNIPFDSRMYQISDLLIGGVPSVFLLFLHFRIACCFAMDVIVDFT